MYAIFNIALDCDIPLPELPEVETADVIIKVKAGPNGAAIPEQPIWLHHWNEPNGRISISCAKQGASYLLRFPELVDFIISQSCELIKYFPRPSLATETIRHLLLDQVIPRALSQQGNIVLHASAVEIKKDVSIAFIGESGHGKSTIASSLHKNGAKLITDDCLLLAEQDGKIIGIPNYYGVRLYSDSATAIFGEQQPLLPVAHYSTKSRFHLPHQTCQEQSIQPSLDALFLLADPTENIESDDIMITSIKGANELISVIEQTFTLDVTDKLSITRQFKNISKLLSSNIKIYRLQYPRKYEFLPTVQTQIKNII